MAIRTSSAAWRGNLRDGQGTMKVGNGSWEGAYSFASRFDEGGGTNPEELIAAAHAGCFSMALSGILTDAGHVPNEIRTTARVSIVPGGGGFSISKIQLETVGDVPGIDEDQFRGYAEEAKKGCPVSRALAAVPEITLQATLTR